jgi:threonine/homoserine/homoserine lactone efflux protein
VLLWGSAAYLLYLAGRIAFAGATIAFIRPERPPGIGAGIALQVINPKAYAVNTALFSGFAFLPGALGAETAIKFAILNVIWVPLHLAWLAAGVGLRRLDLAPGVQRAINFAMAAAMLIVVALAVRAQM